MSHYASIKSKPTAEQDWCDDTVRTMLSGDLGGGSKLFPVGIDVVKDGSVTTEPGVRPWILLQSSPVQHTRIHRLMPRLLAWERSWAWYTLLAEGCMHPEHEHELPYGLHPNGPAHPWWFCCAPCHILWTTRFPDCALPGSWGLYTQPKPWPRLGYVHNHMYQFLLYQFLLFSLPGNMTVLRCRVRLQTRKDIHVSQ